MTNQRAGEPQPRRTESGRQASKKGRSGSWVHLSQRAKVLLDLESQARLARGELPEASRPSRLVEEAVEKLYGRRWRTSDQPALSPVDERRLRNGQRALGLTSRRLTLLIGSLTQETFRVSELGRRAKLARQPASVALRAFQAQGLIKLHRLGPWHMSLWRAEKGPVLKRWMRREA